MKLFGQIVFWIGVIILLTLVFGYTHRSYLYALYFVSFLLPVIVGTSYFYNQVLIPRYLLKRKYLKFGLYAVYTLIISMYLEMVVVYLAFIILANYHYQDMLPVTTNIFLLAITLYAIVFLHAFLLLVKKYLTDQEKLKKLRSDKEKHNKGYMLIRSDRKHVRIRFDDMEYIESLGDYVKIITVDGRSIVTREKISRLQERLPSDFLRIHRSFLVNRDRIRSFTRGEIVLENVSLPVGRTYKDKLNLK